MNLTANQRIAMNAIVSYVRTFARICMALFTSRWVLCALGPSDFGLFGVVGAIIGFISYFNLVMSGSVGRFYAFSIGQASVYKSEARDEEVCAWFNVAFFVHLCIAVLSAGVGYFIGMYAIEHWLSIPADRMIACVWVFRISIVGMFVSVISVPFQALFGAYQYITELVFWDLLMTALIFCGAFGLMYASSDRLILYSLLMGGSTSGILIIQCLRARLVFKECRMKVRFWFFWSRIRQLLSFAGWKMLGVGAWMLRTQGSAIVINMFHGLRYNASYSVATQLSAQSSTLANALSNALNPAVTTVAGTGDRVKFIAYSLNACKFTVILTAFVAVPIICECENVLHLWLGTPPDYAVELCIWFALAFLIESFSSGFTLAISANGRIGLWQMLEAILIVWTLPTLWLCFKFGAIFPTMGALFALSYAMLVVERVIVARKVLGMEVKRWIHQVLIPVSTVILIAFGAGFAVTRMFPVSFFRLCLTTALTLTLQGLLAWRICLRPEERSRILNSIWNAVRMVTGGAYG